MTVIRNRQSAIRNSPGLCPDDLHAIYVRQARWFAGERNRLFRRVDIAQKRRVLDLGAGTGVMLPQLAWRTSGLVVGVDCDGAVLRLGEGNRVIATGESLPFSHASFDLVFTQMFFLWARNVPGVLHEIRRVLEPGGALIAAAEPDYGGVIDFPEGASGIREYAAGLAAQGADIHVARKLAACLHDAGFSVEVGTHPNKPIDPVDRALETNAPSSLSIGPVFRFVPYFHFLATKPR
jgi:SAM-dependent methyltransferase